MLKIDLEAGRTYDTDERIIKSIGDAVRFADGFTPESWKQVGWKRCVQGADNTVYFQKGMSTGDGGRTVAKTDHIIKDGYLVPENAYICEPGFFYHARTDFAHPKLIADGVFAGEAIWSYDNLKTLEHGTTTIHLPPDFGQAISGAVWNQCNFFGGRDILRLPDGRLLATLYASYADPDLAPSDISAVTETKYKQNTIVVVSGDSGKSWRLRGIPGRTLPGDPSGEGYNEASTARISTGELMCVMRTGHYYPLYCAWSGDDGAAWTDPLYMGLERGCAPCLLPMSDGKLALAYGNRFPVGTSPGWYNDESESCMWHNQVKLAICKDGRGRQWIDTVIGRDLGTTYVSIMEVEPNTLLCQTDVWCWRVELEP